MSDIGCLLSPIFLNEVCEGYAEEYVDGWFSYADPAEDEYAGGLDVNLDIPMNGLIIIIEKMVVISLSNMSLRDMGPVITAFTPSRRLPSFSSR